MERCCRRLLALIAVRTIAKIYFLIFNYKIG
jgi:hypothetical protein